MPTKDSKTQSITYGAMIIAIFGMLLLLNRQTGSFFEEVFLYIFPIPMVAYAAIYGWKRSLPVFVGMCLISFLCGTFTSIFYAISQAFIGLVFGTSLNHHRDMTRTLLMVMVLSVVLKSIMRSMPFIGRPSSCFFIGRLSHCSFNGHTWV